MSPHGVTEMIDAGGGIPLNRDPGMFADHQNMSIPIYQIIRGQFVGFILTGTQIDSQCIPASEHLVRQTTLFTQPYGTGPEQLFRALPIGKMGFKQTGHI